ncbi:MAG: hypothetical protein SPJ62_12570 [Inconstantimicrobium porci]|uniref:hypothetical protein n=1 Tax=Inconstantimicrobium porci TaxID=2652291 RepID=UPI002A912BCB|nr:hypothetical protein [Inconstantimicrobium porci]MDY5912805.1 hypothetical protein [Inconstantimicrobium porci]
MKILVVIIFTSIMSFTYLLYSLKRQKFESILILIPACTIIVYMTKLSHSFSNRDNKIIGLVNILAVFLILFNNSSKKVK